MSGNIEKLQDYRKQVQIELDSNSQIGAFILTHNYLEYFTREILKLHLLNRYKQNKEEHVKEITDRIDSINSFGQIFFLFSTNLTLAKEIHYKLIEVNSFRNKLAHKSITLDIQNHSFKNSLAKKIDESLLLCDQLEEMLYEEIFKSIEPQLLKFSSDMKESISKLQKIPEEFKKITKKIKFSFKTKDN